MGFWRLLLMGLLIAMVAVQQVTAPKGKGRQKAMGKRTSESSSSKASEKSAALITDETLDSNYVRLFFDEMEEEARQALEQRIGEFLIKMAKTNSSSSSGTGNNVVEGFLAEMKMTEDELVPQLHLMRLKIILLGKTTAQLKKNEMKKNELKKSELAKRFVKASDEEVLEAKSRMRGLVGRRMFLELEMRLPWLLRLGSDFFFA